MRIPLIAGNWKMNMTISQTTKLLRSLKEGLSEIKGREALVCPPFTSLFAASLELKSTKIRLGAQNVYFERQGAYTGEISSPMLKEIGCEYVIIGHSERRQYFYETNETVNKKIRAAHQENIKIILCVGETLEQREKGAALNVICDHVKNGLKGIKEHGSIVIAYEPVWAIGTGKIATPEQAQETHGYIRSLLKKMYGEEASDTIRILYGGSVKPDNVKGLMSQRDIDGALVGGASLDPDSFIRIVNCNF